MVRNESDFDLTEKFWEKNLHNLKLTRLLGIVGASKEPLSGAQIKNQMKSVFYPASDNRDVYDIINELSPRAEQMIGDLLFCWTDFSGNDAKKLISRMKERLGSRYFEWGNNVNNVCYRIKPTDAKKEHVREIEIHDGEQNSSRMIELKFVNNSEDIESMKGFDSCHPHIQIAITSKHGVLTVPSVTIKKHGKLFVYSKKAQNGNTRYLFADFTHKAKGLIENIEVVDGSEFKEMRRTIQNHRRYSAYSLNLRGLLLYFYRLSIRPPTKKNDKELLKNVLSNPSLLNVAPFLKNAQEFSNRGFPVFQVLTETAAQLKPQVPIEKGIFLIRHALSKRYFVEVNKYFGIHYDDAPFYELLTRYRLDMLNYLKVILTKQLKEINQQYYVYFKNYKKHYVNSPHLLSSLNGYPEPERSELLF